MNTNEERKKCTRCKMNLTLDKFTKKRDDTYQKQCIECCVKTVVSRNKNKCPHSRQKTRCVDCDGIGMCDHGKQKSQCKICSNEIKVTITTIIGNSRQADIKHNRYDANNFIDRCFLESLFEEYPCCYYDDCKVELQYVEYQNNLATIERLDNSIGHIKSNCVICCLSCNSMRKSDNN